MIILEPTVFYACLAAAFCLGAAGTALLGLWIGTKFDEARKALGL